MTHGLKHSFYLVDSVWSSFRELLLQLLEMVDHVIDFVNVDVL